MAGYVTELLADGFRTPHRLLDAYIHAFTGFEPTDGRDAVEEEDAAKFVLEKRYKLDFTKLGKFGDGFPVFPLIICCSWRKVDNHSRTHGSLSHVLCSTIHSLLGRTLC